MKWSFPYPLPGVAGRQHKRTCDMFPCPALGWPSLEWWGQSIPFRSFRDRFFCPPCRPSLAWHWAQHNIPSRKPQAYSKFVSNLHVRIAQFYIQRETVKNSVRKMMKWCSEVEMDMGLVLRVTFRWKPFEDRFLLYSLAEGLETRI